MQTEYQKKMHQPNAQYTFSIYALSFLVELLQNDCANP